MARNISSGLSCTKHPNLHQLPGVCSSCLRERLHQLLLSPETAYPRRRLFLRSPSHSSSSLRYDSLLSGGPWSPPAGSRRRGGQGRHRRNGSVAEGGSVLLSVRLGGSLRKSRSMALVAGRSDEREDQEAVKAVKRGFWSKLIRFRSGRSKEKERWSGHGHKSTTLRDIFAY